MFTPDPSPELLDRLIEAGWNELLPALPAELLPLAVALHLAEYQRTNAQPDRGSALTLANELATRAPVW